MVFKMGRFYNFYFHSIYFKRERIYETWFHAMLKELKIYPVILTATKIELNLEQTSLNSSDFRWINSRWQTCSHLYIFWQIVSGYWLYLDWRKIGKSMSTGNGFCIGPFCIKLAHLHWNEQNRNEPWKNCNMDKQDWIWFIL